MLTNETATIKNVKPGDILYITDVSNFTMATPPLYARVRVLNPPTINESIRVEWITIKDKYIPNGSYRPARFMHLMVPTVNNVMAGDRLVLITDDGYGAKVGAQAIVSDPPSAPPTCINVEWDKFNGLAGSQADGTYRPTAFKYDLKYPGWWPGAGKGKSLDSQLERYTITVKKPEKPRCMTCKVYNPLSLCCEKDGRMSATRRDKDGLCSEHR